MTTFSATCSPEDNKLRLHASTRLDAELYAVVKATGFIWAPLQRLFMTPMWTACSASDARRRGSRRSTWRKCARCG
jgi:hypothetical protein